MGVEAIKARKPAGPLSFQLRPTISVDDDVYAESGAMLRYPRKLGGVYLNREKAAMKVDTILDALETVILEIFQNRFQGGARNILQRNGSALRWCHRQNESQGERPVFAG